ncbi:hypothetical protein [Marinobacter daepoensis]|nr:hypothetical protein [Marinobacter daepoensis]
MSDAGFNYSHFGYLDITFLSDLIHFLDYFKILVSPAPEAAFTTL